MTPLNALNTGPRPMQATKIALNHSAGGGPAEVWIADDIAALREVWPDASAHDAALLHPFQGADVLALRATTMAPHNRTLPVFVAVLAWGGSPAMLLPLGIRRSRGVRVLGFLDGGLSDYNAPVLFPAAEGWSADDIKLVWCTIARHLPRFDLAILERQPLNVGGIANPLLALSEIEEETSGHLAKLTGSWQEYARKRLPHGKDSRRQRKRLEALGELRFEIATTPEQAEEVIEAVRLQKTRRHMETGVRQKFEEPGYRAFVTGSARALSMPRPLHVSALRLNGRIIAAHWGLAARERFYYLVPTYEGGEWQQYSPGRLLLERLLEWSFANGMGSFDFGSGDDPYKKSYVDESVDLRLGMIPNTVMGGLVCQAAATKRWVKKTRFWSRYGNVARKVFGAVLTCARLRTLR